MSVAAMIFCLPFVIGSMILVSASWEALQDAASDYRHARRWRRERVQGLMEADDGVA